MGESRTGTMSSRDGNTMEAGTDKPVGKGTVPDRNDGGGTNTVPVKMMQSPWPVEPMQVH